MIPAYFKAILDHSPESIVLIGKNHEVLAFNKALGDTLYQYHGKQIKEGDLYYPDFVLESNQKAYLDSFNKAMKGEIIQMQRLSEMGKMSLWYEHKMTPIYYQDELIGVTLYHRNITQTKEAELKIIDISEKLKAVLDNTDQSITLLDLDYKILAINSVSANMINNNMNNTIHNMIGLDFRTFIPDKSNSFYEYYPKAAAGLPCLAEISYKNYKDETIWYQTKFNPVYNENKNLIGVSIFAKDITEKKMLEISLQESEDKFRKIARILPVGVLITNKDFEINYSNDTASKIFGYSENEFDKLLITNLIDNFSLKDGRLLQIDNLENEIEHPLFNQEKLHATTKNKEKIEILLDSSLFVSKRNEHYIFVIQDITSINQKDNVINEQNTKLRDIAWYQSHIIRAPLARIMGFCNLLNAGLIDDPQERDFILKEICNSSRELDKVIHDIVFNT